MPDVGGREQDHLLRGCARCHVGALRSGRDTRRRSRRSPSWRSGTPGPPYRRGRIACSRVPGNSIRPAGTGRSINHGGCFGLVRKRRHLWGDQRKVLCAIATPGTWCWSTRDTSRGFKVLVRFVPSYARSSFAEYYRAAERKHPNASLCQPPEPDTFAAPSTRPTGIGMRGRPHRLLLHRRLHRDDSGQGAEWCL